MKIKILISSLIIIVAVLIISIDKIYKGYILPDMRISVNGEEVKIDAQKTGGQIFLYCPKYNAFSLALAKELVGINKHTIIITNDEIQFNKYPLLKGRIIDEKDKYKVIKTLNIKKLKDIVIRYYGQDRELLIKTIIVRQNKNKVIKKIASAQKKPQNNLSINMIENARSSLKALNLNGVFYVTRDIGGGCINYDLFIEAEKISSEYNLNLYFAILNKLGEYDFSNLLIERDHSFIPIQIPTKLNKPIVNEFSSFIGITLGDEIYIVYSDDSECFKKLNSIKDKLNLMRRHENE